MASFGFAKPWAVPNGATWLDIELREAEAALARLPAVSTADPQAETAARLVTWLTASIVSITPHDVHMARVLGMTLLPQLAGLVLMLAIAPGSWEIIVAALAGMDGVDGHCPGSRVGLRRDQPVATVASTRASVPQLNVVCVWPACRQ
jgi:hypothetical protein